ncbi:latent-transforming growth factor beta-binding protein 2 isoform X2 [Nilaparvata lugens]|nr:latent-transforming growth factor beta-binding protein 2 isoform X2 [Nilaparvata lugens]XP_039278372.1 latent-transforming growth factor beta-binding protein 2 isoform X2 [Nilaparvata lugens]
MLLLVHKMSSLQSPASHNISNSHSIDKRQELRSEYVACKAAEDCEEHHDCQAHVCRNPCHSIDCEPIRAGTRCRVEAHRPECKTKEELINPEQWDATPDCAMNDECNFEQWCLNGKCQEACADIDCSSWSDDGICATENHLPVCKVKDGDWDEEQVIQLETEQRNEGDLCKSTHECAFNLVCHTGLCKKPCDQLTCFSDSMSHLNLPYLLSPDKIPQDAESDHKFRCVNEYHVVKCIKNVPYNVALFGCESNEHCGEHQLCVNRKCTDSCKWVDCVSWSFDGYCDVIDHYGACKFELFGSTEDEIEAVASQRRQGAKCINTFQCSHHLACISGRCSDPCDLLWCIGEGAYTPARLVQKRLFPMEYNFNENYKCVTEHHLVRCDLGG